MGSIFGAGGVAHRRPRAAVWSVVAQGVEVEDELQALDFVSNGYKID